MSNDNIKHLTFRININRYAQFIYRLVCVKDCTQELKQSPSRVVLEFFDSMASFDNTFLSFSLSGSWYFGIRQSQFLVAAYQQHITTIGCAVITRVCIFLHVGGVEKQFHVVVTHF